MARWNDEDGPDRLGRIELCENMGNNQLHVVEAVMRKCQNDMKLIIYQYCQGEVCTSYS